MKITNEYIQILNTRVEYFRHKKIWELTDDEIKEFVNLRKEVAEQFTDLKEVVSDMWDVLEPYVKAGEMYAERVIKK